MNDFEEELEGRIALMEKEDYVFPKRLSKKDYLLVAIVAFICAAALVAGGFLL